MCCDGPVHPVQDQLVEARDPVRRRSGCRGRPAVHQQRLHPLYVTRPTLNTYGADAGHLAAMARDLFEVVESGAVKIAVNQTYPLAPAGIAQADLEARKTTGSTVLTV